MDTPNFYENIRDIFLEFDYDYFILCGIRLAHSKISEIIDYFQLIDNYRVLNPDTKM